MTLNNKVLAGLNGTISNSSIQELEEFRKFFGSA
jgi:hypothetical protein